MAGIQAIYKNASGIALSVYKYNPDGHTADDRRTAIAMIHGGGWINGGPGNFYQQGEFFRGLGFCAFAFAYRTKNLANGTPFDCVADARSMVRWLRSNYKTLGIDPERIVICGASAGGLMAYACTYPDRYDDPDDDTAVSCMPNAIVTLNPILDTGVGAYGNNLIGAEYVEFSPIYNIRANLPQMLIMHGNADETAAPPIIEHFAHFYERFGNTCFLEMYADQAHGFYSWDNTEGADNTYFYATSYRIVQFIHDIWGRQNA